MFVVTRFQGQRNTSPSTERRRMEVYVTGIFDESLQGFRHLIYLESVVGSTDRSFHRVLHDHRCLLQEREPALSGAIPERCDITSGDTESAGVP